MALDDFDDNPISVAADPSPEETLRTEIEAEFRAKYQEKLLEQVKEITARLEKESKLAVRAAVEDFKKAQTPPTPEEIGKVLNNEYISFPFKVRMAGGEREFVLQELPSSVERQFLKLMRERLVPFAKELGSLTIDLVAGKTEEKIITFLSSLEPMQEFVTEAVSLILINTEGGTDMVPDKVAQNMSISRQISVLVAQAQAQRLRDFFSHASLLVRGK